MDHPRQVTLPRRWVGTAVVMAGAAGLAMLTWVVAGGPVDYVTAPPVLQRDGIEGPTPSTYQRFSGVPASGEGGELPEWVRILIQLLMLGVGLLLLYLVVAMLRVAFRMLLERWRDPLPHAHPVSVAPLPEVPESLLGPKAAARRDLLLAEGVPRNAVVAAWIDLEASIADGGMVRLRAETPAEYVTRVMATWRIDPASILDLAALYREARFSEHEITETHRVRALADLDRLHADLEAAAGATEVPAAAKGGAP